MPLFDEEDFDKEDERLSQTRFFSDSRKHGRLGKAWMKDFFNLPSPERVRNTSGWKVVSEKEESFVVFHKPTNGKIEVKKAEYSS